MSIPTVPARLRYPVDEAAALLGICRSHLYALIKSGELPSVKDCGRRLISAAALSEYVQRREAESFVSNSA